MLDFRPHIMLWTAKGISSTDPATGWETPDALGIEHAVPCRFHAGGIKEFKNEDNSVVQQKGRIRINSGVATPDVGQAVTVKMGEDVLFEGAIREVFLGGQLGSWRLDV
jgi:hypothetical protein